MASERKIIRKKLADLLKGQTDAGENVFPNQSTPTWHEDLPVILVYPQSEPVELFNTAPREYKRSITMVLEVIATGSEDPNVGKSVEDKLDEIAEQIECVMDPDDTLGGVCDESLLLNSEFDFVNEGSKPIGSVRLTYNIVYYRNAPDSIEKQDGIADLKTSSANWHVGHNGDEDPDLSNTEATDTIDIP